ncbi:MAG: hypothetical protein QW240_04850 [Candidatus Caldarchaeum sp.]
MTHEIATVILMTVLAVDFFVSRRKSTNDTTDVLLSLLVAAGLFFYNVHYRFLNTSMLPLESFDEEKFSLALYIFGFILYCYSFVLPVIPFGVRRIRSHHVHSWMIMAFIIGVWPTIYPDSAPLLWFRWIIFMVYPIMFYFVEGVYAVLREKRRNFVVLVAVSLTMIIVSAGYYLTTGPYNAFPYFSHFNPYKSYIQSSMLQSGIPLDDIPPTLQALEWLSKNAKGVVVLHESFHAWTILCDCKIDNLIVVKERRLTSPNRNNFAEILVRMTQKTEEKVYTIWWLNGHGWYNVYTLPREFYLEIAFEDIAVYVYNPFS